MQGDATIQITGNMAGDVELKYLSNGQPIARFRVLTQPRKFNKTTQQWEDSPSTGWRVTAFGKQAENVAESCPKGARVTVSGTVSERSYEQDGSTKYITEVTAEDVALSLKWDPAKVQRMARASAGATPAGGSIEDPWATGTGAEPAF